MFCENCGKKLIRGYKFCMECGTPAPPDPEEEGGVPEVGAEAGDKTDFGSPRVEPINGGEGSLVFCPTCGMHMQTSSAFCEKCGMPLSGGTSHDSPPAQQPSVQPFNTDPIGVGTDPIGMGLDGMSEGEIEQLNNFVNEAGGLDAGYSGLKTTYSGSSSGDMGSVGGQREPSAKELDELTAQLASFGAAAGEMPAIGVPEVAAPVIHRQTEPKLGEAREMENFAMDDSAGDIAPLSDGAVPVIDGGSMDERPDEDVSLDPYAFVNNVLEGTESYTKPAVEAPAPSYTEPAVEEIQPVFGMPAAEAPAPAYTEPAVEEIQPVFGMPSAEAPAPAYTEPTVEEVQPVFGMPSADAPAPAYTEPAVEEIQPVFGMPSADAPAPAYTEPTVEEVPPVYGMPAAEAPAPAYTEPTVEEVQPVFGMPAAESPAPAYTEPAVEEAQPVFGMPAAEAPAPAYTEPAVEEVQPVFGMPAAESPAPAYTEPVVEEAQPVFGMPAAEAPAPAYTEPVVEEAPSAYGEPIIEEAPYIEESAPFIEEFHEPLPEPIGLNRPEPPAPPVPPAPSAPEAAPTLGKLSYCRNCGQDMYDNEPFCKNCGAPYKAPKKHDPSLDKKTPEKKNKLVPVLIGLGVAVVAVMALIVIPTLNKDDVVSGGNLPVDNGSSVSTPAPVGDGDTDSSGQTGTENASAPEDTSNADDPNNSDNADSSDNGDTPGNTPDADRSEEASTPDKPDTSEASGSSTATTPRTAPHTTPGSPTGTTTASRSSTTPKPTVTTTPKPVTTTTARTPAPVVSTQTKSLESDREKIMDAAAVMAGEVGKIDMLAQNVIYAMENATGNAETTRNSYYSRDFAKNMLSSIDSGKSAVDKAVTAAEPKNSEFDDRYDALCALQKKYNAYYNFIKSPSGGTSKFTDSCASYLSDFNSYLSSNFKYTKFTGSYTTSEVNSAYVAAMSDAVTAANNAVSSFTTLQGKLIDLGKSKFDSSTVTELSKNSVTKTYAKAAAYAAEASAYRLMLSGAPSSYSTAYSDLKTACDELTSLVDLHVMIQENDYSSYSSESKSDIKAAGNAISSVTSAIS